MFRLLLNTLVYTIKYYKMAFQAWKINVKDEMFK